MNGDNLYSRRAMLHRGGGALVIGGLGCGLAIPSRTVWAMPSQKVHIIGTIGDLPMVLQRMVADHGYLREFGLEASFTNVADGNRIMGSIISGEADVCMLSGISQVPVAIERGAKLKILAAATLVLNQCVYAKKPNIQRVKDLEGKTVGVGSLGSLLHQLMLALFEKKGVDASTVKFVNIGNNKDVFRAVVAGVVDAGPSTIDVYNKQAKFGVHNLVDGKMWIELPEYTQQGSYASDHTISTKRDALIRLLAAYAKLYRFLQSPDSQDAFFKAREKTLGREADKADSLFQWNWIQKYKPFAVDLVLSEQRIRYLEKLNIEVKTQKQLLPLSRMLDMTLARDAIQLVAAHGN